MKFLEIDDLLAKMFSETLRTIKERFPNFFENAPSWAGYPEVDSEADQACASLAESKEIPPNISAPALFLCSIKIFQARKLVEFLMNQGTEIPLNHKVRQIEAGPDFLTWVLVDYWKMAGQHRAIYSGFQP